MENWEDHRFFLAAARAQSVRGAAGALGTSRSTVLRRLGALEKRLTVTLFERRPEGYFLTPAGEELYASCVEAEAALMAAQRRIAGQDEALRGAIRVSLPGAMASYLLMEAFAQFTAAHPGIRLDIHSTYDMPDLARREADLAIRVSNDPPEDLVGRCLMKVVRQPYVGRAWLDRTLARDFPPGFCWLSWSSRPELAAWALRTPYPELPVCAVTDPYASLAALKAGMGISLLPRFMGDSDPALVRLPPHRPSYATDLWVLTHPDLRRSARVKALADHVAAALLARRGLIEGAPEKV